MQHTYSPSPHRKKKKERKKEGEGREEEKAIQLFKWTNNRSHIYTGPDFLTTSQEAKSSRYTKGTGLGIKRVLFGSLANLLCDLKRTLPPLCSRYHFCADTVFTFKQCAKPTLIRLKEF